MTADGFSGYVEPGGLTDRVKIKLLICFLMDRLDLPVQAQTVSDIILDKGLANYFEVSAALGELIEQHCVSGVPGTSPEQYVLTRRGRDMLDTIVTDLPLSVRDKVLASADEMVIQKRDREQNKVTVTQVEDGFAISIRMLDIGSDLLRLTLYVPDRETADRVAEKFYKDPAKLYTGVLDLLL